jgi:ATP/maltotriose-dependent transcriptional regulator MalT
MPADPSSGTAAEPQPTPFVGRRAPMARLSRLLEQARAGVPSLVLVEGPAGIGKTALVDWFLNTAGPGCVLHASGEEAEATLPFGVLAQLAVNSPTAPSGALAAVVRRDEGVLDSLVAGAGLVDLLSELQHQTDAVVMLVIDDAHWADRPSLTRSPSRCAACEPTAYSR